MSNWIKEVWEILLIFILFAILGIGVSIAQAQEDQVLPLVKPEHSVNIGNMVYGMDNVDNTLVVINGVRDWKQVRVFELPTLVEVDLGETLNVCSQIGEAVTGMVLLSRTVLAYSCLNQSGSSVRVLNWETRTETVVFQAGYNFGISGLNIYRQGEEKVLAFYTYRQDSAFYLIRLPFDAQNNAGAFSFVSRTDFVAIDQTWSGFPVDVEFDNEGNLFTLFHNQLLIGWGTDWSRDWIIGTDFYSIAPYSGSIYANTATEVVVINAQNPNITELMVPSLNADLAYNKIEIYNDSMVIQYSPYIYMGEWYQMPTLATETTGNDREIVVFSLVSMTETLLQVYTKQ